VKTDRRGGSKRKENREKKKENNVLIHACNNLTETKKPCIETKANHMQSNVRN